MAQMKESSQDVIFETIWGHRAPSLGDGVQVGKSTYAGLVLVLDDLGKSVHRSG